MFDQVVCLNIDKRYDERERITSEFSAHGIDVTFFLAGSGEIRPREEYDRIDTKVPPAAGYPWASRMPSYNAFLCFKKIVEKAKKDGAETLLVLEDDATLTPEFGDVLPAAWVQMHEVSSSWGLFYLGANHTWGKTSPVGTNLLRLQGGSQCWHAVCLHRRAFDLILDLPPESPIDDLCARLLQPFVPCFAVWPNVVLQRPGYSYCDRKYQDYTHYFDCQGKS